MCFWGFNVYMGAEIKEVKMGMGRRGETGELHMRQSVGFWLMLVVCSLSVLGSLHESLLVPVLMHGSETMI